MDALKALHTIIEQSSSCVFFGGAGVSTESGIKDFRSATGLFHSHSGRHISPETCLSLSFFLKDPKTFYDYYLQHLVHENALPNAAHLALANLEKKGKLKAVVTQNIDGLHQKAGSLEVLELHGSMFSNHCLSCGASYDLDYLKKGFLCSVCSGLIKPDVTLYEEPLNEEVYSKAIDVISRADVLIIGGTSLVVYPAAYLVSYFRGKHLVLINQSRTAQDHKADLVIRKPIGEVLSYWAK